MANEDFTQKELCLLFQTVLAEEFNVYLAKDIKDLRSKVDVFTKSDNINIKRVQNKQGKTRVSVFVTSYADECGCLSKAYTTTI